MLIDVFNGRDHKNATPAGRFHFLRPPTPGERVELNGNILVVTRAWHQPGTCYAGAKFAILISDQIPATGTSESAFPVHDEVREVIQP